MKYKNQFQSKLKNYRDEANQTIKFLNENGCKILNDDAYRFYLEKGGSLILRRSST